MIKPKIHREEVSCRIGVHPSYFLPFPSLLSSFSFWPSLIIELVGAACLRKSRDRKFEGKVDSVSIFYDFYLTWIIIYRENNRFYEENTRLGLTESMKR